MRTILLIALMTAPLSFSAKAESTLSPELRSIFYAFDTIPREAELKKVSPTIAADLEKIARDPAADLYLRKKAVSLLSIIPSAPVRHSLETVLRDETVHGEVRRVAAMTLVRSYGLEDPEGMVATMKPYLDHQAPELREGAIRSLSKLTHVKSVRALLTDQLRKEKNQMLKELLQRQLQ